MRNVFFGPFGISESLRPGVIHLSMSGHQHRSSNQLTEACGWEQIPRYLIRDRDGGYGEIFIRRARSISIRDRPTSACSPWQNSYAERLIGSLRRECIDRVVVFGELHRRHVLLSYMRYDNGTRTHLSLNKDAPVSRAAQWTHSLPSDPGRTTSSVRKDLIYDRHTRSRPSMSLKGDERIGRDVRRHSSRSAESSSWTRESCRRELPHLGTQ
jgi:hypothetical protein